MGHASSDGVPCRINSGEDQARSHRHGSQWIHRRFHGEPRSEEGAASQSATLRLSRTRRNDADQRNARSVVDRVEHQVRRDGREVGSRSREAVDGVVSGSVPTVSEKWSSCPAGPVACSRRLRWQLVPAPADGEETSRSGRLKQCRLHAAPNTLAAVARV